jgi:hypothetical protein
MPKKRPARIFTFYHTSLVILSTLHVREEYGARQQRRLSNTAQLIEARLNAEGEVGAAGAAHISQDFG